MAISAVSEFFSTYFNLIIRPSQQQQASQDLLFVCIPFSGNSGSISEDKWSFPTLSRYAIFYSSSLSSPQKKMWGKKTSNPQGWVLLSKCHKSWLLHKAERSSGEIVLLTNKQLLTLICTLGLMGAPSTMWGWLQGYKHLWMTCIASILYQAS